MGNELSDRQAAIRLRLAGESIEDICRTLKRSKRWFHKWWKRYLALGPDGLYDLTRANHRVVVTYALWSTVSRDSRDEKTCLGSLLFAKGFYT